MSFYDQNTAGMTEIFSDSPLFGHPDPEAPEGEGPRLIPPKLNFFVIYKNLRKLSFVLVWLGLSLFTKTAAAAPANIDALASELKSQYLHLRNTDVEIAQTADWEALAKKLVDFADDNSGNESAPSALYNAAIMNEQLGLRFGEQDRFVLATKLLERLAREYTGHRLADDGLIKRADILLYRLDDVPGAKRCLEEVVQDYHEADQYAVAVLKLKAIEDGTYKANEESVAAAPSPRPRGNGPIIVLDPGHGGEDLGAIGVGGLLEKDVTLAVALELERLLVSQLGATVRLTRRKDVFAPLQERTNIANDFDAELFLSIHINASPQHKLSGLETYYLDNGGDAASEKLAERENSSVKYEGGQVSDLQFMLSDLIQNAKLDDSIILATLIQQSVMRTVKGQFPVGPSLGVKKAPFYVLVGAHMPCVLIELFFIDHPVEGQQLAKPEFRRALATGLLSGIREFFARQRHTSGAS